MPNPRHEGSHAPAPVTSARGAPDNADFVRIKTYLPYGLRRVTRPRAPRRGMP